MRLGFAARIPDRRIPVETSIFPVMRARRKGDLNEAAGAADASRAMLRASCPSIMHRIAVLAHARFLSTAKPIAYR
jgi:hypothetical protein